MVNIALEGNERCQNKNKTEFPNQRFCYINLPSTCVDALDSKLYVGLQASEKACVGATSEGIQRISISLKCPFQLKKNDH